MAQKPKEHVRQAILDAAAEELARVGYAGATLGRIAAQAGTSIGNLYKYFPSKEELFEAAIPPQLVREFTALLRQRVKALGSKRRIEGLDPVHPYRLASEELLGFALEHRNALVFLLRRAEGTVYASFSEGLVRTLTKLAIEYTHRAYPKTQFTPTARRALRRIYRGLVGSLASTLSEESSARALHSASDLFGIYHLTGLKAFFESVSSTTTGEQP